MSFFLFLAAFTFWANPKLKLRPKPNINTHIHTHTNMRVQPKLHAMNSQQKLQKQHQHHPPPSLFKSIIALEFKLRFAIKVHRDTHIQTDRETDLHTHTYSGERATGCGALFTYALSRLPLFPFLPANMSGNSNWSRNCACCLRRRCCCSL